MSGVCQGGEVGETYVEVLVGDAKDLEVGMLTDSLCDELVQGADVWHGCGYGRP